MINFKQFLLASMCVYGSEHTLMYVCHEGKNRDGNVKEGVINDYDDMCKHRVRDIYLSIKKNGAIFWR